MNFLLKVSFVITVCLSFAYALPHYYNYTMITLNDRETVDLSPILKSGTEGVNYIIGGATTSGKYVTLRDHLSGNGIVVVNSYNQRNELLIAADPSVKADSGAIHQLLLCELKWMQKNGIVNLTDEAISTAVTVIMAKKAVDCAIMYFTNSRTAEPVAGAIDFQYSVPPSPLQIGSKLDSRYVAVVLNTSDIVSPTSIDKLGKPNENFFKVSDLLRPNGEYDYYSYTYRSHFDEQSLIFIEFDRSATRNQLGSILCFFLDTLKNATGYNYGPAIYAELDFLVKAGCLQIPVNTIQKAADSLSAKGAGFWYETANGQIQPRIGLPDINFKLPPSPLLSPSKSFKQSAGHGEALVLSILKPISLYGGLDFFIDGLGMTKTLSMLSVVDLNGRTIRHFPIIAGKYESPTEIFWDGRNQNGKAVKNGRYIVQLKTSSLQLSRPFHLVRH